MLCTALHCHDCKFWIRLIQNAVLLRLSFSRITLFLRVSRNFPDLFVGQESRSPLSVHPPAVIPHPQ